MKVLLLEHVEDLGKAGDLVEVKPGYANNYLLPRGLAAIATKANMNEIKAKQRAAQARAQRELEAAQEQGKKLQGKVVVIKAKSGEAGRLYGTITNQDVADELLQHEIEVDKRNIQISEDIKTVGKYEAQVRLHPEVTADFVISVEALEE
ncbi:MAG: 50S ribosomal protein L9 [Eubacteriales bacterium]|nr:50S ribosomal protein L9 [Eubacteriales bacterium]